MENCMLNIKLSSERFFTSPFQLQIMKFAQHFSELNMVGTTCVAGLIQVLTGSPIKSLQEFPSEALLVQRN